MDLMVVTDSDGNQPVMFYYIHPGHALELHAGKSKFRNNFIISMNARSPGPILVFAFLDALMTVLPFKDFNILLAMLSHCITCFMPTRQAQPKLFTLSNLR